MLQAISLAPLEIEQAYLLLHFLSAYLYEILMVTVDIMVEIARDTPPSEWLLLTCIFIFMIPETNFWSLFSSFSFLRLLSGTNLLLHQQ